MLKLKPIDNEMRCSMEYIFLDLEFNQGIVPPEYINHPKLSNEIIQIGAVKLDQNLQFLGGFRRYVKPTLYTTVSTFITELTSITTEDVDNQDNFPEVYEDFIQFVGSKDNALCIWGMSDIKEIHRNIVFHNLDSESLPKNVINLQPYVSIQLGYPKQKPLALRFSIEALEIPQPYAYHDAYYDALYTSELFKKVHHLGIEPILYEPSSNGENSSQAQVKRVIDFPALFAQFEKMFQRPMTEEELKMIKLAYQMGKTHQFLKLESPTNDFDSKNITS